MYEVLFESIEGKLLEFSDIYLKNEAIKNKKFLIQIIYKDIILNDKPKKLLFFKDVSFGILYELFVAQYKFDDMINQTLN